MPTQAAANKLKLRLSKPKSREKGEEKAKAPKSKPRVRLPTVMQRSQFTRAFFFTQKTASEMLRKMSRIRQFEEKVFELVTDNKVSGASHVYSGQEAVAVGACSILRADDYIT